MKKPRIEDFDPNALPSLRSPMDSLPAIVRPERPALRGEPVKPVVGEEPVVTDDDSGRVLMTRRSRASDEPEEQNSGQSRTPVRTYGRTLARIPFEIYQDQHAALKQFSLDEQTRGEKGSMSQMVREALDEYITRRRRRRGP
ncbi:MAG: hypothetical protein IT307_13960 [Chloroflexi bacterium]|nr:hypothetical protein [Chloroflexota bacterium]